MLFLTSCITFKPQKTQRLADYNKVFNLSFLWDLFIHSALNKTVARIVNKS